MTPAIIITILVILAVWYLSVRKTGMERRISKIKNREVLPSGLQVWREEGAPFMLTTAAESAMTEMFQLAEAKGYRNRLSLNQYVLVVIRADERASDGSPAFRVTDKGYEGTQYDKGDYVLASGQFLEPDTILIPYHSGSEICHLKEVIKHEMTHALLFHNHKQKYDETRIHNGLPFEL